MSRPSVDDLTGDHPLALLARRYWLTPSPSKPLAETIDALWTAVEADPTNFSLLLLEQLQTVERFLWPGYSDDSSNHHVFLLVLLVNIKRQENLPIWPLFADRPDDFSSFFQRVAHLVIDQAIAVRLRTHLLAFLLAAFQSLDNALVRKECAPLVSVGLWQNLHSDAAREAYLSKGVQLQKAWRAAGKKYESADPVGQARLRFERSWLFSLVLDLLRRLYDGNAAAGQKQDNLLFCERVLELLCDLQSQLPTRRYTNGLLQDLNISTAVRLSSLYQDGDDSALLRDMLQLLEHYMHFPVDDQTGRQLSRKDWNESHNVRISRLQSVALKLHPESLKILILANFGALSQRDELLGHTKVLSDSQMLELCANLNLRTAYPESCLVVVDRALLDDALATCIVLRTFYTDAVRALPVLPTEQILYATSTLRTDAYDGVRPLATPKLNLQYLCLPDFLTRSYILHRIEAFFEIRTHLEDTVKRLKPGRQGSQIEFNGFSRMAVPIGKPAIIEVASPRVGEDTPAEVRVEVILDVGRLQPGLRREWESLRPDDVVYLLAVTPPSVETKGAANGHALLSEAERAGVKALRCAEVINVLDESGKMLRRDQEHRDYIDGARVRQRRLLLRLDAAAYGADKIIADAGKTDVYDSINLIVRRKSRENNFKSVLDTLKQLTLSEGMPIPDWFQDVFLGFGDPAAATYKRLANRLQSIDYRDTFLDWQHLTEALPGKTVEPDPSADASFPPPYVLEAVAPAEAEPVGRPSKKRRRDQPHGPQSTPAAETLRVTTYQPPNNGPFPTDVPKVNSIRFTPAQVSAITSGTQPGLTVIVGPPGTGKTDVTVQIISNIYHNHPDQRILLVAHSNQALNQLFEKIVKLDVDERHLLRLGHGEEELQTEGNFGKAGRIESFAERGAVLLREVQQLADSVGAVGVHGGSCETAQYFEQVWLRPLWKRFWDAVSAGGDAAAEFPFHAFFAAAPQPLFDEHGSRDAMIEVAKGCERHVSRVFEELADIRPFEILRGQRDKANYLLVKEARIVAMTSTHAAIRRREIAAAGFRYENVVVEEAAQVMEAEGFVPLVMQESNGLIGGAKSTGGLQRVILVGDHLQNSPIVRHPGLRDYAHLEQSLFQRLIRLGVPHTTLDAQGRSRPSIAALYKWRYPSLTNLPLTSTLPEFTGANAGLKNEYQFISVPDYKGTGESQPMAFSYQNLGEAEYAVALYQYMRLLGYPAQKITILCTYAGQRALIREILERRCGGKMARLFGMPGWVGTVDKYQGEQNDYVILSLVRTAGVGFLRDLRRLTVALSRARLGLYVLGRREVFETSLELRDAMGDLMAKGDKLELVIGEMFPTTRQLDAEMEGTEIDGVEHLGQYVYEMTQAKMKMLKAGQGLLPPVETPGQVEQGADQEDEDGDVEEGLLPVDEMEADEDVV